MERVILPLSERDETELLDNAGDDAGVLAAQLTLVARQWLRVPYVVVIICAYVGYLTWEHAPHAKFYAWTALTLGVLVARAVLIARLLRNGAFERAPQRWAGVVSALAFASGLICGAAALLFFDALPRENQALLTMVMCCWGAGALAASGAYPRAYFAFSVAFFSQIALGWLLTDAPDRALVALLLALFVAVLAVYVRDNGRMVEQSIRIRFENAGLVRRLQAAHRNAESARQRAEEANRSKSQFLAAASHDLRQPLHALSLLTAVLNSMDGGARVNEIGVRIGQSVQSLDQLFAALLDLSKLDAGVLVAEPREISLAATLAAVESEARSRVEARGLRFDSDIEPLAVRTDPLLLQRIVRNLLENAARYTHSGSVALRCRLAGGAALIEVADTGVGIPPEEQERVFREFYRLHPPELEGSIGFGLGLAIVRRLAGLLEAKLELISQPGEGSTFTLTIPRARSEQVPPPEADVPSRDPIAGLHGTVVLVIEDDAAVRAAMTLALRRWDCEPIVVATLDDARAALEDGAPRPQVIVADLRLAGGADGIAALERLREEYGDIPGVIVTGDTGADRLAQIRRSGHRVLHKPVQAEELMSVIRQLTKQA